MAKKMTMEKWEKSKADAKMDKGVKEGSAKDKRLDKKGVKAANKKRK